MFDETPKIKFEIKQRKEEDISEEFSSLAEIEWPVIYWIFVENCFMAVWSAPSSDQLGANKLIKAQEVAIKVICGARGK